jgi:hypothetical protein
MNKPLFALLALCAAFAVAPPAYAGTVTSVSSPQHATTGAAITVTVAGTNPCGAAHINYADGTAITYPIEHLPTSQTHVYDKPGTYTITARGMGNCDGEATTTVTVSAPPGQSHAAGEITAVEISPNPARVGAQVTIAVSGTGVCAYEVHYGDGNVQEVRGPLPQQYRHTYPRPARATVIVKATPPCTGTFSQLLQIFDPATGIGRIDRVVLSPATAVAGERISITVEGVSGCVGYTLDYGDGNIQERAAALPDVVQHLYPSPGRYVVSATAVAPCVGRARAAVDVRRSSAAAAPRIARILLSPGTVNPGEEVAITVEGNGTCDGYTLDYGDGNSESRSGALPDRARHVYRVPGRYMLTAVATGSCAGDVRAPLDVRGRRRR